jgi:hypothetical protein
MKKRLWVPAAVFLALGLAVAAFILFGPDPDPGDPDPEPYAVYDHPLARTTPDPEWAGRGDFQLPLDETFELQLGLGSGWGGFDLHKVSADGNVAYEYKGHHGRWGRKRFQFGKADLERLVGQVNSLGIFRLHKGYHADAVDGTQWCLLIKTGGRSKVVYCNNHFPAELQKLARFVHVELVAPHAAKVKGEAVPKGEHRKHGKEIWASIR